MSATITTIIPTYRRPQLLRRAVTSVLGQTFADFRVCVYDNASGDDTGAVAASLRARDPRVSYFCQPTNVGGAANFLFGMQQVDTPFFSFLSDDDVLLPEFFETALAGFERCPQALLSTASTVEVSEDGAVRYVPLALWRRDGVYQPPAGAFAMLGNRHPTWTTILFRREALEHVGLLDLEVGPPSDLDYELRVAARFPIVVSFRPCGAYVHHTESGSVRETAELAAGFDVMRRNVEEDDRLEPETRRALADGLRRQLRVKLLEVWGKALVRGDDAVALDAARAMRDRYGPAAAGALLVFGWYVCTRAGVFRSVLRSVERMRLRARARRGGVSLDERSVDQIRRALSA